MSRYLLLFLLNLPFILMAILGAITRYKLKKISSRRAIVQIVIWAIIAAGIALAEPIYNWLFSNNLTQTEPLSLFDVVQITAIVFILYVINRMRIKTEVLEKDLRSLHRELSIKFSTEKTKKKSI